MKRKEEGGEEPESGVDSLEKKGIERFESKVSLFNDGISTTIFWSDDVKGYIVDTNSEGSKRFLNRGRNFVSRRKESAQKLVKDLADLASNLDSEYKKAIKEQGDNDDLKEQFYQKWVGSVGDTLDNLRSYEIERDSLRKPMIDEMKKESAQKRMVLLKEKIGMDDLSVDDQLTKVNQHLDGGELKQADKKRLETAQSFLLQWKELLTKYKENITSVSDPKEFDRSATDYRKRLHELKKQFEKEMKGVLDQGQWSWLEKMLKEGYLDIDKGLTSEFKYGFIFEGDVAADYKLKVNPEKKEEFQKLAKERAVAKQNEKMFDLGVSDEEWEKMDESKRFEVVRIASRRVHKDVRNKIMEVITLNQTGKLKRKEVFSTLFKGMFAGTNKLNINRKEQENDYFLYEVFTDSNFIESICFDQRFPEGEEILDRRNTRVIKGLVDLGREYLPEYVDVMMVNWYEEGLEEKYKPTEQGKGSKLPGGDSSVSDRSFEYFMNLVNFTQKFGLDVDFNKFGYGREEDWAKKVLRNIHLPDLGLIGGGGGEDSVDYLGEYFRMYEEVFSREELVDYIESVLLEKELISGSGGHDFSYGGMADLEVDKRVFVDPIVRTAKEMGYLSLRDIQELLRDSRATGKFDVESAIGGVVNEERNQGLELVVEAQEADIDMEKLKELMKSNPEALKKLLEG
ncbi:MAG: hypothetical protein ABIJ23_04370 [Candidatus Magasanikbacteria bacterium]